jgi:hypothetical protein
MMNLAVTTRSLWEATKPAVRGCRDLAHNLHCLMLPRRLAESYALPDAVIIGAQKCGTTSLYHYLLYHPAVVRPTKKEVHYFDNNYARGLKWYRLHFSRRHGRLNFESSPYYLFHPKVPERLAATVPHAKLIVMLRDPVARAYSHYWHEKRLGHEHLSFADAIEAEDERLAGESTRLSEDDGYRSYNHEHYSYVERGRYVEQIERWFQFFARNQFLFVDSERFFVSPAREMARVTAFLGLSPLGEIAWTKQNVGSYADRIEPSLRRALCAGFADANRGLDDVTGAMWSWNR